MTTPIMGLGQKLAVKAMPVIAPLIAESLRYRNRFRRAPFNVKVFASAGFASIMAVMLLVGYLLGMSVTQSSALAKWRNEIADHYHRISKMGQAEIRLLASKSGYLEARLIRMEVIGKRLVAVHDLSPEEFDFQYNPGVGGKISDTGRINSPQLAQSFDRLNSRLEETELQLAILLDLIDRNTLKREMLPKGWPVSKGWISSKYGYRISPFSGRREFHAGIDIAGQYENKIYSIGSGVVKRSGHYGNYGNIVEIDHGNGYVTRYGHNQVNLVNEGEVVKQRDIIALMGGSGRSTGPHLHFEVIKHGRKIDPAKYLR